MTRVAIIDANSIAVFQQERIQNIAGPSTTAIDHIFSNGCVLLDHQNFIQQQWLETASCGNYKLSILDWIADRMQEGKVRIVEYKKDTALNKSLAGFQMTLGDRVYVFLAVCGQARMIVTFDIDFHDPTKKAAKSTVKEKIKKSKCGPVCQYLKKFYGIAIGDWAEVPTLLP